MQRQSQEQKPPCFKKEDDMVLILSVSRVYKHQISSFMVYVYPSIYMKIYSSDQVKIRIATVTNVSVWSGGGWLNKQNFRQAICLSDIVIPALAFTWDLGHSGKEFLNWGWNSGPSTVSGSLLLPSNGWDFISKLGRSWRSRGLLQLLNSNVPLLKNPPGCCFTFH